ncbi:MAG: hypothetical protein GIW99_11295 [Candidatus Eremiobacteraeota bacterium]|nr:hypothetical protein [Candidatus Eremiobacteraeota bacterium]
MNVLLVSNGFGEAAIAASIARAIATKAPAATVEHAPLVGRFDGPIWPPVVGPRLDMPSGGLITYGNVKNLLRDLRSGLVTLSISQFRFLSRQRRRDAVVAVGDVYCLAVCLLFVRRPTMFVATAKSEYVARHSRLECAVARRGGATFARDAATAAALARRGVPARFAGNAMMDELDQTECRLPAPSGAPAIGILPGSRRDAVQNAARAVRRLRRIAALLPSAGPLQAFIAAAPTVDISDLMRALCAEGIAPSATGARRGVVARSHGGPIHISIVAGCLGDVLRASTIVLGQAGTGNEQAAGAGRPVVAALEGRERQSRMGWYRMRQQRLLGEALLVLPADDAQFASGVVALLNDQGRMEAMGRVGRMRMGAAGASAAVAQAVLALETRE